MRRSAHFALIFIFFFGFFIFKSNAQCFQVFDGNNSLSSSPYWISCSGSAYTLNLIANNSFGPYTVDWGDGSSDNGVAYIAGDTIAHSYALTTDSFVVVVTSTLPNCQLTGVVVMETPVVAGAVLVLAQDSAICNGESIQFTNSSSNVSETTHFTWNFGDGSNQSYLSSNAGQTISHAYSAANVNCKTSVTLIAYNYCNSVSPDTAVIDPIYVFKKDIPSVSVDATVKCGVGVPFTFTNNSTQNCSGNGNTIQRYERWNFHDYWGLGYDSLTAWKPWPPANPETISFPTTGSFSATLIDSSFCGRDSSSKIVLVLNAPIAGLNGVTPTGCVGTAMTFNNTSATGYTYKWNFGDNATFTPFPFGPVSHTYSAPGTYTVSVAAIVASGNSTCRDTERVVITVLPLPVSAFTPSALTGCDSVSLALTDNSVSAVTWDWKKNGSSFSSLQNPPAQTLTAGTHTINLTVTNVGGCVHSSQQVITVYESPQAEFSVTNICENVSAQFSDSSVSTDPIVNWAWDFGDGSPVSASQSPSHIYTSDGSFMLSLTVATANCSDTVSIPLTVNNEPAATFNANITSGCSPLSVSFTNTSNGANSYSWDFGNGDTSVLSDPAAVFINATTSNIIFTTQLIATSSAGCSDTADLNITVFSLPQSVFTISDSIGCSPLNVSFTNTSTGAASLWDFGDGSPVSALTNPSHVYSNTSSATQNFITSLITTDGNGCSDTSSFSVQVFPELNVSISMSADSGCAPFTVVFSGSTGASTYQWDFGDGNNANGASVAHSYNNNLLIDTVFYAQLVGINTFGCVDTISDSITVVASPQASFSAPSLNGCSPLTVSFANTSAGAVISSWNFGDGTPNSPVTNPIHVFSNSSTSSTANYFVQLITNNSFGCADTISDTIVVQPIVIAAFTPDTPQCANSAMNFTNNSAGAVNFVWNFGDGNSSSVVSPAHAYANTGTTTINYNAGLIASNSFGCSDTAISTVNIYPQPLSNFTASPVVQTFPSSTVNVTNSSTNVSGWSYSWNFGDGTTSNLFQPLAHNYSSPGTYTISLIISNGVCADTLDKTISILSPLPVANTSGTFFGCAPLTVSFTNSSLYATSYLWDFGDGTTSGAVNGDHTYTASGVYTVKLIAISAAGSDTLNLVNAVTVKVTPTANFTANPTSVSIPEGTVVFTNSSINANTYVWDFGDDDTSHAVNPTHEYVDEGEYSVTLYALRFNGCADTFYFSSVKVERISDIEVPNAFSPNPYGPSEDGTYDPAAKNNDIFHPIVIGAKKFEMSIYNRWGEVVFFTDDPLKGWDGYYKGKLCQQDVYIWRIVAEMSDDKIIKKAGDVLLVR